MALKKIMKIKFNFFILLLAIIACNPNNSKNKIGFKNEAEIYKTSSSKIDFPYSQLDKFKYAHIKKFFPGIFKNDSLPLIDSIFHFKIISQIDGFSFPYSDKPKNLLILVFKSRIRYSCTTHYPN